MWSNQNHLVEMILRSLMQQPVLGLPCGQDISFEEQSNINSKGAEDSHPWDLRSGKHEVQNRGMSKINRTRTVKGVVKEAEEIIGQELDRHENKPQSVNAEDFYHTNLDIWEESSLAGRGRHGNGKPCF
ncbi:hypothetical protein SAY86_012006 [Trapa natans]|uniref:Uncharacterized protein n=1 Tax=Trapa natans TaxID=22666 RepID=A0AAN7R8U1_TRANT|nr:hypothetical protein SAY86_012006 [Trapa natans]